MALRIYLCGRIAMVGDAGPSTSADLPGRQGRLASPDSAGTGASRFLRPTHRLRVGQNRPSTRRARWRRSSASCACSSASRPGRRSNDRRRSGTYELRLPSVSTVDLQDARNAIDLAEGDRRRHDVEAAWANATVAVSIARRGFLPSEAARWVRTVRAELERVALRGLDCLTWVWTKRDNGVLATAMAQQAVELAPLHEPACVLDDHPRRVRQSSGRAPDLQPLPRGARRRARRAAGPGHRRALRAPSVEVTGVRRRVFVLWAGRLIE